MLHAARCKCRTQKSRQKSPSGHHPTTLSGYIFATKACIDNRKKLVKQQYLLYMSSQYGELRQSPPNFSPFLLWPNGWMHQDATWYGGRPHPKRLCVRCGPSSPPLKKGSTAPNFGHVYCGQTAAFIRIPLGTQVGLSLGDIVLDRDPAPPRPPIFGQCPFRSNGWMN